MCPLPYRLYKDIQFYEKELYGYHTKLATENDEEKCRILNLLIGENQRTTASLRTTIQNSINDMVALLNEYKALFDDDIEGLQQSQIFQDAKEAYQSMAAIGFVVDNNL